VLTAPAEHNNVNTHNARNISSADYTSNSFYTEYSKVSFNWLFLPVSVGPVVLMDCQTNEL
jgi:hypothetical protein